ncbi:hypothetical protein [Burkholderia gladioli]|uniref:hypothetical protein n=1 Tax=Burkholderia gladioli TaxID=28095 RepID=UPI00163F3084|nr:hypothetical protein [Burkholderia gladioli]
MKKSALSSLALAVLLTACSSSKDANNSNFEKAINTHLAKTCVSIKPGGFMVGNTYPIAIALESPNSYRSQQQTDKLNADNTRPLEVLVKAGLLSVKDGTTKPSWTFVATPKEVPAKIYNLTDDGKKALANPDGKGTDLCAGRYKVDEVVRFTQPSNAMGSTMSEVSYTFSTVDVPAWAKSDEVRQVYTGLASQLADHQKGRTMLVLASDGWIEASDFGK